LRDTRAERRDGRWGFAELRRRLRHPMGRGDGMGLAATGYNQQRE